MSSQYYLAEIHVRTTSGDLVTTYRGGTCPAGKSVQEVRAAAEKAALDQEPGGRVEGSRVSTDGPLPFTQEEVR